MKNNLSLLALMCTCMLFSSCEDEKKTDESFIYPLAIGNTWEYARESILYYYDIDTVGADQHYDTTTYTSNATVTVTGKVILHDSLEVYELSASEVYSVGQYTGSGYYRNEDDGLYFYQTTGSTMSLPKAQQSSKIRFKGHEFDSFRQLSNMIQDMAPSYSVMLKSIDTEDPPLKVIQYPIEIGDQWTYRESENPWRMDRLVSAQKEIEFQSGTFDCFEIRFIYDMDEDGNWDDDIWIVDYISREGLIERSIIVLGMQSINPINADLIGYIDAYDVRSLTNLIIE